MNRNLYFQPNPNTAKREAFVGIVFIVGGATLILRSSSHAMLLSGGIILMLAGGLLANISHLRYYNPNQQTAEIRRMRAFPLILIVLILRNAYRTLLLRVHGSRRAPPKAIKP